MYLLVIIMTIKLFSLKSLLKLKPTFFYNKLFLKIIFFSLNKKAKNLHLNVIMSLNVL